MDKHTAYNVLNSIHSRLVIAMTFTNLKEQAGTEALKSATLDLNKYIQAEFKEEADRQKDFMM